MPQLQEDHQGPDQAPHVHAQEGHEEHHSGGAARVQPFRRYIPAILDMNHPRARIHNLRDVRHKFKVACQQLVLLASCIEAGQIRYKRARKCGDALQRYILQTRLATLEGVRHMFFAYAYEKAEVIENLEADLLSMYGIAWNDGLMDESFEHQGETSGGDLDMDDDINYEGSYLFSDDEEDSSSNNSGDTETYWRNNQQQYNLSYWQFSRIRAAVVQHCTIFGSHQSHHILSLENTSISFTINLFSNNNFIIPIT